MAEEQLPYPCPCSCSCSCSCPHPQGHPCPCSSSCSCSHPQGHPCPCSSSCSCPPQQRPQTQMTQERVRINGGMAMAEERPCPHDYSDPKPLSMASVLCSFICIFLFLAGVTAMTVYFVYHPRKPRFSVARASIYDLNTTCSPFVSTSMQFTILARNPNKGVTIYYDKLSAYVSYRNQQITPSMDLPPVRHRRKSTVALSPVLGGEGVMVSAEVVNGLAVDEAYGVVAMRVVLVGRLRWKAGAIKTVKYGFYVKCDVWVGLKKGVSGLAPLLEAPPCKVDV